MNTFRSEPEASCSTYSWTSPQLRNTNSSGWSVSTPARRLKAAWAKRRISLPPPTRAAVRPVSTATSSWRTAFGVGAAQHRIEEGHRPDAGGIRSKPRRRMGTQQLKPLVGLGGAARAEAERLGQAEPRSAWKPLTASMAPAVNGLAAIADQDALGMEFAVGDRRGHGIGILGLVQQHVVGQQPGVGELPELEVAAVGEPQPASGSDRSSQARCASGTRRWPGVRGPPPSVRAQG